MKKLSKVLPASIISFSIMLSGLPALADDTDIFINQQTVANSRPNILFVTDTSGSMGASDVLQFADPYDPGRVYIGNFTKDDYYYSHGANPFNANRNFPLAPEINFCKGLPDRIAESGVYEGDLIGIHDFTGSFSNFSRFSGWWDLRIGQFYGHEYTAIECLDDYAVHGPSDASSQVYPTVSRGDSIDNPSNGWVSNVNDAFNYSSRNTYGAIYSGNYVNYVNSTAFTQTTRINAVRGVLDSLISSMNNVNFGLMSFDRFNSQGGEIDYPISNVATDRDALRNVASTYGASGGTPLAETLYEAARYFRGDTVDYGFRSHANATNGNGSEYISPIDSECQASAIIYLTDGEPTGDGNTNTIGQYIGQSCGGGSDSNGNCMNEIAGYLANTDLRPDLSGEQTVRTFTVGFRTDFDLLADTARDGKGSYFTVENADGLATSIRSIVQSISQEGASFTAPGISVNFFGSLENNNEIYYSLFQPEAQERWAGNLKRFSVAIGADGNAEILDLQNRPAIDEDDGRILDGAQSFWSPIADGAEVAIGGAASQVGAPRNVFTYLGSVPDVNLATDENKIRPSNNAITAAMLGASGASDREDILNFAQGFDVLNELGLGISEPLQRIGDPLHSQPAVVQYKESGNQSTVVFFGTNEGFIHAIDAEDGSEIFGFMPKEVLPNLKRYLDNAPLTSEKPYGIDGEIELFVNDRNGDGYIRNPNGSLQSGEGAFLFVGQRRGGSNYYALDVSDVNAPRLMWQISPKGDFAELGQTWARPQLARIKLDGKEIPALIVSGGYDEFQDGATTRVADSKGRAIYVIHAITGEKIWSVGNENASGVDLKDDEMVNSFPAAPAILDSNGNSVIDTIIAADSAGRIWRFDINENNTSTSNFATGGLIAELGDNNTASNRRFFSTPDLTIDRRTGFDDAILVAIGSGRRPTPLENVTDDRFFVVRSEPSSGPLKDSSGVIQDYPVIESSDLADLTAPNSFSNARGTPTEQQYRNAGFYIDLLNNGEKILGNVVVFSGHAVFSSYTPNTTTNACGSNLGTNNAYIVNLDDPDIRVNVPLRQAGIAPKPSFLILCTGPDCHTSGDPNQKRQAVLCIGTECIDKEQTDYTKVSKTGEETSGNIAEVYGNLQILGGSREQLIRFWTEE